MDGRKELQHRGRGTRPEGSGTANLPCSQGVQSRVPRDGNQRPRQEGRRAVLHDRPPVRRVRRQAFRPRNRARGSQEPWLLRKTLSHPLP